MHAALHRVGIDIVPYSGRYFVDPKRSEILRALSVDLVADVGANEGQYGSALRRGGYRGSIVSFEPLSDAFERLRKRRDDLWSAHCVALGPVAGRETLYRSSNSWSSSLLPITRRHVEVRPDSSYVAREEVEVRTLDSYELRGRIYLKVDAQGYELAILDGASETLENGVVALELELSTTPLYEGQPLLDEVLGALRARGFVLLSLTPTLSDATTGEVLQLDGIFANEGAMGSGGGR